MNELMAQADARSLLGTRKLATIEDCLRRTASVAGACAELGVYKGGSARLIARSQPDKAVYLFDTFSGMPAHSQGDVHQIGEFADTSLEGVKSFLADCPNVVFRVGFFPESARDLDETFSFVHIDGDQYQTTLDALAYFYPRMSIGGVMLFDDYQWPNCPGVERALREFMAGKPERFISPAQYQAMIVKGESALGKSTPEFSEVLSGEALELHVAANGIGDAICGLYAACGAAESGRAVVLYTKHNCWFERLRHPGVTTRDYEERGVNLSGDWANYEDQLRFGTDRKQWYCDNITKGLSGHSITPRAPQLDRSIGTVRYPGDYIVLAPFSAHVSRHWTLAGWRYLAKLIADAGMKYVAIDSAGNDARLAECFGAVGSDWGSWFAGMDAPGITDLMLGARAVVGMDSGMQHVAAMLDVPTIALHAHLSPRHLWSCTDVVSVTPQTKCTFCRWQPERGYSFICDGGCSALASIAPEQVMEKVLRFQNAGRI